MEIKTIKAKRGSFLTQKAALEDEGQRIFIKELSGFGINSNDWRNATKKEKDEWETAHPIEEV